MAARIPEGGLKDLEDVEGWLGRMPQADRGAIGRVIAHRATMRILPFAVRSFSTERPLLSPTDLPLGVFSLNLISRIRLKYTSREVRNADYYGFGSYTNVVGAQAWDNVAARVAAAARVSADVARHADDAIDGYVGDAAHAADVAQAADAAGFFAARACSAAAGAAAIASAASAADVWEAASADAQSLIGRGNVSMDGVPLWPVSVPSWWEVEWREMQQVMQNLDDRKGGGAGTGKWRVWMEWYAARAEGKAPWGLPEKTAEELELRIALGDRRENFWGGEDIRREPEEINAEISEWVDSARAERTAPVSGPLWDFFISYSSHDEVMAREIDEIIRATGHNTFVQFRDFGPGTNLVREMQRGFAYSGRVIALYSPDYEASDHCQAEWSAAYNADPGSAKGKLLPFLLRPTELNMLARQIIYTDLVGLDADARKQAVLRAIAYKPEPRSKADLKKILADIQTPVPVTETHGGLEMMGLTSNPALDAPLSGDDLREMPGWLIDLANGILVSLPGNTPPAFRAFLELYQKHLIERGPRPHTDRLRSFVGPLRKEFEGVESSQWSPGLEEAISDFLKKHELLITQYPLPEARERALSETPIDEAKATGTELTEPIYAAAETLEHLSKFDMTTEEFDAFVANVLRAADEYALMPFTVADDARPQTEITPKRRFVLTTAGFFERTAAFIAASVTIAATPQGQAAILVLRKSVEKLLAFVI